MKIVQRLLFLAAAVVILGGVAGVLITQHKAARIAASQGKLVKANLARARSVAQSAAAPAMPQEAIALPQNPLRLEPVEAFGMTNSNRQKAVTQANQGGPPAKQPVKDPVARIALAFVGADGEAEAYWYGAINDSNLPPNERQDLIEDLNEDGLSDPKHPTADDLSLIVSRLLLIEEVGPDAMDKVNADAFQEAYKDLVNLANLAMGGGEPVR